MVRILLVEDETVIANNMVDMLENMGYHILGNASNAREAHDILAKEKPDLILLDMNLNSKTDGIHLASEINEMHDVPFIYTTSHGDGHSIQRAMETNPTSFLEKPVEQDQLYTAIEMAMFKIAQKHDVAHTPEPQHEAGMIIKDAIFIKDKYRYTKLKIDDLLWIKAEGNYLELHLQDRKELIRASLTSFLERLNRFHFFRTHKSYAVNMNAITKFDKISVAIKNTEIPITKTCAEELLKRLNVL